MSRERFDTPDWLITYAERFQDLQQLAAVRGLSRLLTGSSSPAYAQARWETVDQVVDESGEQRDLPIAAADPNASMATSLMPRLKEQAVIVGAGRLSMDAILFKHQALPAVAYTYSDKTHAGTLIALGHEYLDDNEDVLDTAALRVGRNEFGVGIGGWVPSEKTIILPKDLDIIQYVSVRALTELFSGTPLV